MVCRDWTGRFGGSDCVLEKTSFGPRAAVNQLRGQAQYNGGRWIMYRTMLLVFPVVFSFELTYAQQQRALAAPCDNYCRMRQDFQNCRVGNKNHLDDKTCRRCTDVLCVCRPADNDPATPFCIPTSQPTKIWIGTGEVDCGCTAQQIAGSGQSESKAVSRSTDTGLTEDIHLCLATKKK